jgi:hypothetical protein
VERDLVEFTGTEPDEEGSSWLPRRRKPNPKNHSGGQLLQRSADHDSPQGRGEQEPAHHRPGLKPKAPFGLEAAPTERCGMAGDRHIYGAVNSKTGMKRLITDIRRDVEDEDKTSPRIMRATNGGPSWTEIRKGPPGSDWSGCHRDP